MPALGSAAKLFRRTSAGDAGWREFFPRNVGGTCEERNVEVEITRGRVRTGMLSRKPGRHGCRRILRPGNGASTADYKHFRSAKHPSTPSMLTFLSGKGRSTPSKVIFHYRKQGFDGRMPLFRPENRASTPSKGRFRNGNACSPASKGGLRNRNACNLASKASFQRGNGASTPSTLTFFSGKGPSTRSKVIFQYRKEGFDGRGQNFKQLIYSDLENGFRVLR